MKIALIGYGRMGKQIEELLPEKGHTVCAKIDGSLGKEELIKALEGADVAIEFSQPNAAVYNLKTCFEARVPVVCGTTGWYDAFDDVVKACEERGGGLFHATNFSVGVNVFFHINEWIARLMKHFDSYNPSLKETHHIHKLDEPSGTAISLAEGFLKAYGWEDWKLVKEDETSIDGQLPVIAERRGEVPGIHKIIYESEVDTISISHAAKGRIGFASGAILAAEFLAGKQGVYSMKDLLKLPN